MSDKVRRRASPRTEKCGATITTRGKPRRARVSRRKAGAQR